MKTLNKTSFPVSYSLYPPAALYKQDMVSSPAFIYRKHCATSLYVHVDGKERGNVFVNAHPRRPFSYFIFLYFRFDSFVSLSSRVHWNRLPTNKVSDFISASRRGVIPIVFRMESISLLCWNDATVYIVLFYTIPPERNFWDRFSWYLLGD